MIHIKPVSDLRNRFPEIERLVQEQGQPVFLTKNGYGSMVLLSLEHYISLISQVDSILDEAEEVAESSSVRYTADEVFSRIRSRLGEKKL